MPCNKFYMTAGHDVNFETTINIRQVNNNNFYKNLKFSLVLSLFLHAPDNRAMVHIEP